MDRTNRDPPKTTIHLVFRLLHTHSLSPTTYCVWLYQVYNGHSICIEWSEPHWLDSHWAEIRMPFGVVELIMLFPSCLQESTL